MACCGESCKTIRLFLWYIQFQLWLWWKLFLQCKSVDQALDEIAQHCDHKHSISGSGRRRQQQQQQKPQRQSGGRFLKRKIRPETWHQLKGDNKRQKYKAVKVHYPVDATDLVRTIRTVQRFRPIGAGQSWRDVIDTGDSGGELISLALMNQLLHVDHKNLQVTFQAGILVRDAIRLLAENYGLAFCNIGNYDRQTLGGAIAGGTHGTSGASRSDTITSSIIELKMVTAQGGDITLEPEESVTYGIGGIIYQVTLKVTDFYYLRQITTTVEPALIDFEQWWEFDYGSFMAKWTMPNDPSCSSCHLIQYEKATKEEYEEYRQVAKRERKSRLFWQAALPFTPKWMLRRSTALLQDQNLVDTYFRVYVDEPTPHCVEWEYAVPMCNHPHEIVDRIPEAVVHISFPCEVLMRISPKDAAIGHLAHDHDVVWFNLRVVVPKGQLTAQELDDIADPFEQLVTASGPEPVIAHPHKLIVRPERAGLTQDKVDFLASFQYTHDPKGKMFNDALADMLRGRKPKLSDIA